MTTPQQPLGPDERESLQAFRAAAAEVRDATVIDRAQDIRLKGELVAPGKVEITADLFGSEPFRSLAMSVRLVYQNDEPGNFGRICGILDRCGDVAIRERARELRRAYNDILNRPSEFLLFIGLFMHRPLLALSDPQHSPRVMFEAWLYYGAFHRDPNRKADYEACAKLGAVFPYTVQSVVVLLAGRIMDLDDVVADFLGERRIPRIGEAEAPA